MAVAGTLLGVVVGLIGERLIRRIGRVRCVIGDGDWSGHMVEYRPDGSMPKERHLQVAFVNGKELPVTIWEMGVEFYKGGKPLEEWARPVVQFVDERGDPRPLGPVNLPPHMTMPLTLRVLPDRDDKLREMEDVDKAVFVATLMGARDTRRELHPPWRETKNRS